MEPVYGTIIQAARLAWRLQGLTFTVTGVENLPVTGGGVVAINHTGYFDFTFAGLPAYRQRRGRKVRFMAKKEVFDHRISGPIMRSLRHIEVDRHSGAASFEQACLALKSGELVGVYPEATISRSFEIKEFKSGAARMAIAADVPIVPHIVWGAQRIWTKGHPKKLLRPKVPIAVAVGEPIPPTLPPVEPIPPTSTAAPPMWRWSTSPTGPVNSRGACRPPTYCATISPTRCPCGSALFAPILGTSKEKYESRSCTTTFAARGDRTRC